MGNGTPSRAGVTKVLDRAFCGPGEKFEQKLMMRYCRGDLREWDGTTQSAQNEPP